ncbi:MAG TPA: LptF/LptG family permease [Anaeromyxobacter sp.]|nr:LptF/LptG family permease [Anaeromyxobacter sp.]
MSILDRYLAKEILLPFVAGVLFLTQLLLATQLLAQAEVLFGSGVGLRDVGAILVALLPHVLGYVLPIAFLLGAVLGVGRLAEDREVMALGAAGVSPVGLVRVPLALGIGAGALGLWLSLTLEPAGLAAARVRVNEIVKRNVTNDVRAGTFYDQIPGYTLYAEQVHRGGWEHVLISDRSDPSSPVLALAGGGRLEPVGTGQEMQLVLEGGELHREDTVAGEYVTADFRRAEVVLGLGTALTDRSGSLLRGVREMTSGQMRARIREARARGNEAEALRFEGYLNRRVAQPLAVLPFALLAVPLGASRRAGRAFAVGATLLAVVAHYVLLRGGEVLAQKALLPPPLALQLPTIALSLVALALVAQQARRGVGAVR